MPQIIIQNHELYTLLLVLFGAFLLKEAGSEAIKRFFRKTVETDYVPLSMCNGYRGACGSDRKTDMKAVFDRLNSIDVKLGCIEGYIRGREEAEGK